MYFCVIELEVKTGRGNDARMQFDTRLIYILILQNYIYIWLLIVINILNYKTSRKNIRCLQLTNKLRK